MAKTPQKVLKPLGIKKLSGTELKFMDVIWENPQGISSEDIYSRFNQALGTKTTILHRIVNKGMLTVKQNGRHYIYTPKFTKQEYMQAFFKDKLKREFGMTAFEEVAAAFCGRSGLRPDESERVKQLLVDLTNG